MSLDIWDHINERWPLAAPTAQLYTLAATKIPMILWLTPRLLAISSHEARIRIPLNYRSKNHLGSLYFGALCVGADLAGGLLAFRLIAQQKKHSGVAMNLVFKNFSCDFLKRPDFDTVFICSDGAKIQKCIDRCLAIGGRHECLIKVSAYTEDNLQLPVADFQLTLSIKPQSS